MKVLVFTNGQKTSPLVKRLSKEFKKSLVFGVVRKTEAKIWEIFGIRKAPAIIVVNNPDANLGVPYRGAIQAEQIKKFLKNHAYDAQINLK